MHQIGKKRHGVFSPPPPNTINLSFDGSGGSRINNRSLITFFFTATPPPDTPVNFIRQIPAGTLVLVMTNPQSEIFESHSFGNCCAPGMRRLLSIYLLWAHIAPPPPIRTEVKFAKNAHIFKTNTKKSKNKKVNILYNFLLCLQIKIGWTY